MGFTGFRRFKGFKGFKEFTGSRGRAWPRRSGSEAPRILMRDIADCTRP
jgi:hypothetical protein